MRLGFLPQGIKKAIKGKNNIWIHAVSVGEVLAISKLTQDIKARFPGKDVVISTVTKTGYAVAQSAFPRDVVIYAPLDLSFIVRRYVALIKPEIYIAAETEIWPNIFSALNQRNIPIIQVNGRISDKAFGGYRRIRFLLKRILKSVYVFCMQSQLDADRIIHLGAEEKKVKVVGNMKFDDVSSSSLLSLKGLKFNESDLLLIAGSTHPGEEEILLSIFKKISEEFSDLRLVLAPRHVERTEEILNLIRRENLKPVKFSQIQEASIDRYTIVVVDRIGHLKSLYGLAHVVFVGKSLVASGGQNIIEPASFAKAIFVGPRMENFKDITEAFVRDRAIIQVKDADDLLVRLTALLRNPKEIEALGLLAKGVVEKNRGATARTLQIISQELECSTSL